MSTLNIKQDILNPEFYLMIPYQNVCTHNLAVIYLLVLPKDKS